MRTVETKGARFQLRNGYVGVVDTGVHQAIDSFLLAVSVNNLQLALGNFQSLFDALGQAAAAVGIVHQTVDHYFDAVFVVFFQFGKFVQRINNPVHAGSGKTGTLELFRDMLKRPFFVHDNRCQDKQTGFFGQGGYLVHNSLRSLAGHRFAANRTMRHANTRK